MSKYPSRRAAIIAAAERAAFCGVALTGAVGDRMRCLEPIGTRC